MRLLRDARLDQAEHRPLGSGAAGAGRPGRGGHCRRPRRVRRQPHDRLPRVDSDRSLVTARPTSAGQPADSARSRAAWVRPCSHPALTQPAGVRVQREPQIWSYTRTGGPKRQIIRPRRQLYGIAASGHRRARDALRS
jgi:hypothetical protein